MTLGLSIPISYGQSFLDRRHYSVSVEYGYGKIQYYDNHTPVYTIGSDENAPKYSPSWQIKLDGTWLLSHRFDFVFALSHLTITEKYSSNLSPDWEGFGEDHLIQGFLHITPAINIKLPDDRFKINLGFRMGMANLIGNTNIRGSSKSLGPLHADLCIETGFIVRCSNKLAIETNWIEGLSKYDYTVSMPVVFVNYFKYRSFLVGVKYLMNADD